MARVRPLSALLGSGRAPARPAAAELWWLRPPPLIVLVIVPLYLSFLTFDYEHVIDRRYLPNANYWWGLLLLFALALGAALSGTLRGRRGAVASEDAATLQIPAWFTAPLLLFTVVAYVVWFGPLVFEPASVIEVF